MVLQREKLDKIDISYCPNSKCRGILIGGALAKECPKCGQTFLPALLFEDVLNAEGFNDRIKNKEN